jgi:hypothetical protein
VKAGGLSARKAELLWSSADDGVDERLAEIDRVLAEKLTLWG